MALTAVPLLKLGRVLEEFGLRCVTSAMSPVPILTELRGTVRATNDELVKLSVVTEDAAKVSRNATVRGQRERRTDDQFVLSDPRRTVGQDGGFQLWRPKGDSWQRLGPP